ncbi:orotidine-5'-phosphate decarboxylase [Desulfurispora thermophila]|uniref:orotidine-5'-phosphate decarboxylase n=1 Tax=Desulfurispora thermophila TaxID=265470 RepID=UPI000370639D|nr:orotidine-5'-phosphate decarboxylase [Desulfurispora thermophila]
MIQAKHKLIIALDVPDRQSVRQYVTMLAPYAGMFKVGMELYYSQGPGIIEEIKSLGGKIFLDLKLHDIPRTVGRAVSVLAALGVDMLNVHASGGLAMLQAAVEAARSAQQPPLMIAVTALTSLDERVWRQELGFGCSIEEKVRDWALLAKQAGLQGVVASAREIEIIKTHCGREFQVVTPGIRPSGSEPGDQKRVLTPGAAIAAGADYLVVGRPILQAPDPVAAARQILEEIEPVSTDLNVGSCLVLDT